MRIKKIKAKKIKNSRGEDTINIRVESDNGVGEASAPSGASKGKHECKDFVLPIEESVKFLNTNEELRSLEINNFNDLNKLEKIVNKDKYGGNILIALEYAVLKCIGPLWKIFNKKREMIQAEQSRLDSLYVHKEEISDEDKKILGLEYKKETNAADLLKRPNFSHEIVTSLSVVGPPSWGPEKPNIEQIEQVQLQIES